MGMGICSRPWAKQIEGAEAATTTSPRGDERQPGGWIMDGWGLSGGAATHPIIYAQLFTR